MSAVSAARISPVIVSGCRLNEPPSGRAAGKAGTISNKALRPLDGVLRDNRCEAAAGLGFYGSWWRWREISLRYPLKCGVRPAFFMPGLSGSVSPPPFAGECAHCPAPSLLASLWPCHRTSR